MWISVFLMLLSVVYFTRRYLFAVKQGRVQGFIFNPLLHLLFFLFFYLLVASFFASIDIPYTFFGYGHLLGTVEKSNLISNIFYFTILFFYFLSKDNLITYNHDVSVSQEYRILFFIFGLILLVYYFFVFFSSLMTVFPYRHLGRTDVFSIYVESIFIPFRYGLVTNLAIFYVMFSMVFSAGRVFTFTSVIILVLILLIDATHGGRAISLKVLILVYLLVVFKSSKSYLFNIASACICLIAFGLLQRGSDADVFQSLYVALGEFILTRITTDVVLTYELTGESIHPLVCFLSSAFPGFIARYIEIDSCFIGELIMEQTNSTFGLASNVVTESVFFFGDFYIISPVFMGLYFLVINKYFTRFGFFGFVFLVFTIISIQDMVRTSFYSYGLINLYLCLSYVLFPLILLAKKRLFIFQKVL